MIGINKIRIGLSASSPSPYGPNILPNGSPISGTTGWTAFNSTLSETAGVLRSTGSTDGAQGFRSDLLAVDAGVHRLTFNFSERNVTGNTFLYVGTTPFGIEVSFQNLGTTTGPYQYDLTLDGTDIYVAFASAGTATTGQFIGFSSIGLRKRL